MKYKCVPMLHADNTTSVGIVRLPHLLFITQEEQNPDYQQYLAWLAEGNTPEEWQPNE